MQYAAVLGVVLLAATATAQAIPQATLTALAPITITGSAGPAVTHPAGPLTNVSLLGPLGFSHASYQCAVQNGIGTCGMSAALGTGWGFGSGGWASVSADLLLVVTAPAPAGPVAVRLDITHGGDEPGSTAFVVDFGNDGSAEASTFSWTSSGIWRHYTTVDLATGAFPVRIRSNAQSTSGPQSYYLVLEVVPWAPGATPVAGACPWGVSTGGAFGPIYFTNHQLAALPAAAPNLCELRAIGLGVFDVFVVSDQPSTLPFTPPGPFSHACHVLANALVVAPGVASGNPQFTDWSLTVPPLPSGLALYVQHVSMMPSPPAYWSSFGATNRLRIDT